MAVTITSILLQSTWPKPRIKAGHSRPDSHSGSIGFWVFEFIIFNPIKILQKFGSDSVRSLGRLNSGLVTFPKPVEPKILIFRF